VRRMPAVLLLSVDFPGLGGATGIREVRQLSPATRVVVMSPHVNEDEELEVLRRGAKGYSGPVESATLTKMVEKVEEGEVWAGRKTIGALFDEFYGLADELAVNEHAAWQSQIKRLTSRERQIIRLLGKGASNKEIAVRLGLSTSTVKAHLTKIFRKLGQPDRVHLALYIAALGGLDVDDSIEPEKTN
jgi:DNA-binding NarL/FixJ family response regulator